MEFFKKLTKKGIWQWVKNNQDFLLVNVLLVIKILFFSHAVGLGFGPTSMLLSSAAVLFVLSCWFFLLPYRVRTSLLLLYDVLVSFILLADMVFFRFFHNVISVPVLFEAGQVEGVSGSVMNLFSRWDWLLFADLLFLIPYFIKLNRRHGHQPLYFFRKLGQVVAILAICLLFLNFSTKKVEATFSINAWTGLNWNHTVLQNMGIVNFHLYDIYKYVQQKDAKVSLDGDIQPLKDWMSQHRQQATSNYTGVAQGKNVIIIQLEAMQGFVVNHSVDGQEITPNLDKLIGSSMYFDNYFTQIAQGNTSDAEFATLNSLYPSGTGSNYIMKSNNTYQSLPWLLKAAGYTGAYAFHGNKPEMWNRNNMYPAEGFDQFYSLSNGLKLDENVIMGLSDRSLYNQTLAKMEQFKAPYLTWMITLSGHYPYNIPDNLKGLKIPTGQYSQLFTDYLQSQHYADQCLGQFIANLKQAGILDNSVLVIYGDHFGTGWTNQDIEKFLDMKQPLNDYTLHELNKVPMLIRLPNRQGAGVKDITGGEMDMLPTLANLLGLNTDNMFYFGQDLLNIKPSQGFTAFRYYSPDGSFATNDLFYIASNDGVFEHGKAYDRHTGQEVNIEEAKAGYNQAMWQLRMSDLIIQTNGLPQLLPKIH